MQDSRLAGIVNNAGIAVAGPVEFIPLDRWRAQLEINVLGVVSMVQAFTPLLRESRGRIVTVGSLGGRLAQPMAAPYCASKHALEAISDALRLELRPWDISVSLIQPGAVQDTDLGQGAARRRGAAQQRASRGAHAVRSGRRHRHQDGDPRERDRGGPHARWRAPSSTRCCRRTPGRGTRWGARRSCSSRSPGSCPDRLKDELLLRVSGLPRHAGATADHLVDALRGTRPRLIDWTTLAGTARMPWCGSGAERSAGCAACPSRTANGFPTADARGTVVIVHGINEHGGRYRHVAERLVRDGWMVAALDHRGHGLSGGRRAAVERFDDWVTDLDSYIRDVLVGAPRPLFLLGHSLGGLIAAVYALRHQDALDGLVLSSPSVVPPRSVSPATARAGRFLSRWASNLPVLALRLDAVSRDPAVVAAYRSDPLVHLGKVRARTGAEILRAIAEVQRDIARLRLPVLSVQGTVDLLVDPDAARWVDAHVGSADHTLRVYQGLYHEVFNEPERDSVLDDVARWLDAHAAVAAPRR